MYPVCPVCPVRPVPYHHPDGPGELGQRLPHPPDQGSSVLEPVGMILIIRSSKNNLSISLGTPGTISSPIVMISVSSELSNNKYELQDEQESSCSSSLQVSSLQVSDILRTAVCRAGHREQGTRSSLLFHGLYNTAGRGESQRGEHSHSAWRGRDRNTTMVTAQINISCVFTYIHVEFFFI